MASNARSFPRYARYEAPVELRGRFRERIYLGLAALAILRFWILPLRASFWLDETATFWTAYKGVAEAIHRCQHAPGQSLAYSILSAIVMHIGGQSEVVLRLPSLFAGLGTLWVLFKLSKRLFDLEAAFLSVVVFASLPEVLPEIPNARPYAIALFLVVASTFQLVRWFDTAKYRNMLAYASLSAAIVYFQPLLATIGLAHLAYAIMRLRTGGRISWPRLILCAVLVLALISPAVWYVLRVQHTSSKLAYAGTPHGQELVNSLFPPILGTSIFIGLLIGYFVWRDARAKAAPDLHSEDIVLLLSWFALPILILFLVSRFTPYKLFVPRYYLGASPALALLGAWGLRSIFPSRLRVLLSAALVGGMFVANGTWIGPFQHEDWRAAAESVRAAGVDQNAPILVHTGLVETASATWGPGRNPDTLLLCPLSKYPMPGRIILVPYLLGPDTDRYLQLISSQYLDSAQQFVLVQQADLPFGPWLQGKLGAQFVSHVVTAGSNRITVITFRPR